MGENTLEGFIEYAQRAVKEFATVPEDDPNWSIYYGYATCLCTGYETRLAKYCGMSYSTLVYNVALSFLISFGIGAIFEAVRGVSDQNGFRYITSTSNNSASTSYDLPSSLTNLSYISTILNSTPFGIQANMIIDLLNKMPIYIGGYNGPRC